MTFVLHCIGTGKENIDACIAEVQPSKFFVDKPLECLCCVLEAKGIRKNSKRPKGVVTAVLWMSPGSTGI